MQAKEDTDEVVEDSSSKSLLPGVPDEITINLILTRLPWRNVYALASLGRAWRSALKSREVHHARVRANSTQTLVALVHDDPKLARLGFRNLEYSLSLYDTVKGTWHLLPKVPGIRCGIPDGCGCVSLNGKLYIIGGRGEALVHFSNEVHEFDPAGTGVWKQCAGMRSGRAVFACDVNGGKIYVFGGMGAESAAEVYDPVQDVWHVIASMLSNRMQHKVVHVGDEFFIHSGKYFSSSRHWHDAHFAEVYDSCKNEWRRVENFTGNNPRYAKAVEAVFVIYSRIFKILDDWLYIYDGPTSSWRYLQCISWDGFKARRRFIRQPNYNALAASAVAVKGELLALVYGVTPTNDVVLNPLRSEGFGRLARPLVWKEVPSSLHFRPCHCMCAIEL